jgi:flagellar motor protein MotB
LHGSPGTSAQNANESKEEQPPTPLDIVLQTPPRNGAQRGEHQKHPHLEASPYEHHFDTYSLVQDLVKGGFTEDQAVTIMKAVRLILALNLDIAKEGLVSKSDDENETYLFRAACSELATSLQTSRHSEIQHQRTQRAHLHHEYDILNQKVSQDMVSLREELKAMFNERKMTVQEDKQRLDSKISELNYEITVLLNSDSKSEVEGLRWVLTRRAAMAIAISAREYSL